MILQKKKKKTLTVNDAKARYAPASRNRLMYVRKHTMAVCTKNILYVIVIRSWNNNLSSHSRSLTFVLQMHVSESLHPIESQYRPILGDFEKIFIVTLREKVAYQHVYH